MIFFPSGDSKTERSDPPWASMVIAVLALAGYFLVLLPLKKEHSSRKDIAEQELLQTLGQQFRQGNLSNRFWEEAQGDLSIIGKPENRDIFAPEVVSAWRDMQTVPLPMKVLERESPIRKLLMVVTPHEESVLLAGLVCLLFAGYFFEHLYDRQVLASLFFLSGGLWLILEPYAPAQWWPPPLFSWSLTIWVLTFVLWLRAPKASITVTFRTWFFKVIQGTMDVPILFFPLFFGLFLVVHHLKFSIYQDFFSLQIMAAPAGMALAFLLFLMFASYRDEDDGGPEAWANRQFARAEGCFERQQSEEGMKILKKLLISQPAIAQVRRAGELAWRYDNHEMAEQAYTNVLRDALASKDLVRIIKTLEDMANKHLTVPGSALQSAMAAAMKKNMLGDVRNLLPHFSRHQEIGDQDVARVYEELVGKITVQSHPNKEFLYDCLVWLESYAPDSEAILKAKTFFEAQQKASESFKAATSMHLIHKHVDVKLMEVTNNYVALVLQGQEKVQKVPWTAVEGLFGCHVTRGERGYRGSIFLKFKRKIFSCNFTRKSMMIKDRHNQPVGFEAVWDSLKEHSPEDLPFLDLNAFPDVSDLSDYPRLTQEFIDG